MFGDIDSSDKGLFTFYFEQTLQQQQSGASKLKKKPLADVQLLPHKQINRKATPRQSIQHKINKNLSKQQIKEKSIIKQNIVDLGKDTRLQQFKAIKRTPPTPLRTRQLSVFIKGAESFRGADSSIFSSQENLHYTPEVTREQFNMHSLHRHKKTKKVTHQLQKDPLSSERRAVFELPPIKSLQEVKRESRPRKSLKSKLIQEALHSGDRERIKQIRKYLHGESSISPSKEKAVQVSEAVSRSMRVFEFRQERLLAILSKFRKQ